ncbi:MAG: hypothetical protein RMJ56_03255 [Gemmataceae bacterium]|nr:hypothetical protein [Gemmata sp.]MDW8196606.1 hypothetical protein [Gemmataceae bacterium]
MRWPSADEEKCLLESLRVGNPLAPHDIITKYLSLLVGYLQNKNPNLDEHLLNTAAEEALLNFLLQPTTFDSQRSSFHRFLCMAAQADLKNLLEKERRARRAISLECVAEPGYVRKDECEPEISWQQPQLQAEIAALNPRERAVLELMKDGVRETRPYATKLGLTHLDENQQRMEVKRWKDRIKRRFRRAVVQRT